MNREKCNELAKIIANFRADEISTLDTDHVVRWISQFDAEVQDPILEEMIYVFSDWYLTRDFILKEYLDKIPEILQKKYGFSSEAETCKHVSFINMQSVGQSQKTLIAELKHLKQEQYGTTLFTGIEQTISHYAYVDDGFYSGSKARKDLRELAYRLKPGDTVDVFYLVMCTSAFLYAKKEFKQLADECKIEIKFHPFAKIDNDRWTHKEYEHGTETEWWMKYHMCLWPSASSKADPIIDAYYEYLKTLPENCEKYPYRKSPWIDDPGIFSTAERRALVEHEFLKKGIQIYNQYPNNKGMYPLGYNLWPSFGFGVLFATDYNVPNNAPLVIWADSDWYPLLPRRNNNQNDTFDIEDDVDFDRDYPSEDYYNTCPDCGRLFGLDEDGGNGFCIDCAWAH